MNLSNPNKIALLTDSTADLSPAMLAGKPIYVVPLKILCQDGEYSDGVDIFAGDIYQRLRRGELPRTSLPSGGSVSDAFARIRADGYEKVIAIMLSSGLSGTYNMVRLQGQQQEGLEVAVFDSKSGALGIGVILLQLWEEIQAGAGWDTLVNQRVPHLIANTFPFFSVDTLEYLYKGGRIGKITAMAGSLLQIKPIITFLCRRRTASKRRQGPRQAPAAGQIHRADHKAPGGPAGAAVQHRRGQRRRAGADGTAAGKNAPGLSGAPALLGGGAGRHSQRIYRGRGRRRRRAVHRLSRPFSHCSICKKVSQGSRLTARTLRDFFHSLPPHPLPASAGAYPSSGATAIILGQRRAI